MSCYVRGQSKALTQPQLVVLCPLGPLTLKIPALVALMKLLHKWHMTPSVHPRVHANTCRVTYWDIVLWPCGGNAPLGSLSGSSRSPVKPWRHRRCSQPGKGRCKTGRMDGMLKDGGERQRVIEETSVKFRGENEENQVRHREENKFASRGKRRIEVAIWNIISWTQLLYLWSHGYRKTTRHGAPS